MTDGIYQKSLGYDPVNNVLDFHNAKILVDPDTLVSGGVSVAVAKAVFAHHLGAGNIGPGTLYVVGCHGEDRIKHAVAQCIADQGGVPVEQPKPWGTNPGALLWAPARPNAPTEQTSAVMSPPPRLNPEAREFVPRSTGPSNLGAPRVVSSLNRSAAVFVPYGEHKPT
ncbi:hypothetical protein H4CHR_05573 [Variovorax sp. PBS-H4]|uniref:hypothetical protein n=1 Tax=Variovorax sp. PBS-H4 TaxID=434008 RepID=UPI001315F6A9|nr:hypothetical protein [Variovorax sp. PBS-H4]VTU40840.1 hypothetical protein H4CHR_05573 [Variovorax sp. PBS-H4]